MKKDLKMKNIKFIRLALPVRYGEEDMPNCMPFRKDNTFSIMYNLEDGKICGFKDIKVDLKGIIEWNKKQNRVSSNMLEDVLIFELNDMKVTDEGSYFLFDSEGKIVYSIIEDYVPDSYSVDGEYGDYINLHIDLKNGKIINLKKNATFREFLESNS